MVLYAEDFCIMNSDLEKIYTRARQLETLMAQPETTADSSAMQKYAREYRDLKEIIDSAEQLEKMETEIAETKEVLAKESDLEVRALAAEDLERLNSSFLILHSTLDELLHPADPLDKRNIVMEIRAGTGGDEAALFAAELFRMYSRYAERQGWKTSLVSSSRTDLDGFKEVIFTIEGKSVYRALKWESGVHRVQRIPDTEKSGRVHTSAATVAVLPEAEDVDIELDPKDLKIETSTAGGHGGQSVNTTYSAIRMTHIPTGITVSCQDERSQQQNRARAMQIMRARVFAYEQEKRDKERRDARRGQIGTGDRSEKIRTYNFPQDRVTDHRIKENWHNINGILEGNLDPIVDALAKAEKESK